MKDFSSFSGHRSAFTPGFRYFYLALPAIVLLLALTLTAVVYAGSFEGSDGDLVIGSSGMDWENAPNLVVATDKPAGNADDSLKGGNRRRGRLPLLGPAVKSSYATAS